MKTTFTTHCPKCKEVFMIPIDTEGMLVEEEKYSVLRAYSKLINGVRKCLHGKPDPEIEKNRKKEKPRKGKITIGDTTVKLNGKPFVVEVDTFDGGDWFGGYFETEEKAIEYARTKGGTMHKTHAYDKNGNHIGEGGAF